MPRGGGTKRTKSAPPQWPWNRLSLPGPGPGPSTQCSAAQNSGLDTEGQRAADRTRDSSDICSLGMAEGRCLISNFQRSRWREFWYSEFYAEGLDASTASAGCFDPIASALVAPEGALVIECARERLRPI